MIMAVLRIVQVIDGLIPPINWPDWVSAPFDYFSDGVAGGSISLNAAFAYIHPSVYDLLFLMLALKAAERFIRRVRALVSTATGGGGVAS